MFKKIDSSYIPLSNVELNGTQFGLQSVARNETDSSKGQASRYYLSRARYSLANRGNVEVGFGSSAPRFNEGNTFSS